MDGLLSWLKTPITFVVTLLTAFMNPLLPIVGILVSCFADPGGAVNSFACMCIDIIAFPFPSSPPELKIASLITNMGNAIPLIGSAILFDFAQTFTAIIVIYCGVKIYKLIPFKMS